MTRRWLVIVGVVVIAAVLAFPLRGIVHQLIVVPLAYLLWLLGRWVDERGLHPLDQGLHFGT